MHKIFLILGASFSAIGVILGAFGAHALHSYLVENNRLDTFETAVKYQFYHALGLLLLGVLMSQVQERSFVYSGYGFLVGILLFSGSLYALCFTGYTKFGAITPIGGLAFIMGWIALIWGVVKSF